MNFYDFYSVLSVVVFCVFFSVHNTSNTFMGIHGTKRALAISVHLVITVVGSSFFIYYVGNWLVRSFTIEFFKHAVFVLFTLFTIYIFINLLYRVTYKVFRGKHDYT